MPLLLLPRPLTPLLRLLRLLTLPSLLTLLRPLTQSRLKPLLPSNLRIIVRKTGRKTGFFSSSFSPRSSTRPGQFRERTSALLPSLANPSRTHQNALQATAARRLPHRTDKALTAYPAGLGNLLLSRDGHAQQCSQQGINGQQMSSRSQERETNCFCRAARISDRTLTGSRLIRRQASRNLLPGKRCRCHRRSTRGRFRSPHAPVPACCSAG